LVVGDIRDGGALDAAMSAHKPDMIMHFAARAYVGESVENPSIYYDTNVGGTLSLLQAMLRNDVRSIVFSSTCATYGTPQSLPISEATPQEPINPYGLTKLTAERMLADFQRAYGLSWMALRYFNAAGADPDGELGEEHDPETHAIPLALQTALGLRGAFQVLGTDYQTPDGSAVRDYVHVSDLADAHVRGAEHLINGGDSRAVNLATGVGVSVFEIINAAECATGRPIAVVHSPRRPGDPPALVATGQLARELLNWTPRFTDINETVATAARWMMSRQFASAQSKRAS
jgi:UDP-arabinose 4-epimerase